MPWISGKERAAAVRAALKERIEKDHLQPTLAVLLIGTDPASRLYVDLKQRAAEEVGVHIIIDQRDACSTDEALAQIHAWNNDVNVHGILVQLPLPQGLDTDMIIDAIAPEKDVDSFHPKNRAALLAGEARFFSPVHLAVLHLIAATPLILNGAKTILLAKSEVFSEPLAHLLRKAGAFVEVSSTIPFPTKLKEAKLIITALGQAHIFSGGMFAEDATIIDISTNRLADGTTVGDVEATTVLDTQYISPVPGGVGPLTIAFLLKNVVDAAAHTIPSGS